MPEPTIRILQPGDEEALRAFVLPRLASSVFLLSNMQAGGLAYQGEIYQGTYAAAWEAGAIVGVAASYWQGNLVLQAPTQLDQLWRAAIRASGRAVTGMVGPAEQVAAVVVQLGLTPADCLMDETEGLYSLDLAELLMPPALASGDLVGRPIEPRDLALVARWRAGYSVEALGDQPSPALDATCRAYAERALAERRFWLVEERGQPVAGSGFNAATAEVVQVGPVWTPPALRGRGYARAVVATSLLAAREQGVPLGVLFTGHRNLAAQKAYRALGFRQVGDYRIVRLKAARQPDALPPVTTD